MENTFNSYDDARSLIKDGDIIFFRSSKKSSFFARAISFFTRSPYFHVGIAFWLYTNSGNEKRLFIAEANNKYGRRIGPLSLYMRTDMDIVRLESPTWTQMAPSTLDLVGRVPYSYMDIIEFAVEELIGKEPNNHKGEICSEMVAKIMINAGYDKPLEGFINPRDLVKTLTNNGEPVVLQIRNI